jgi:hypothetical protein
MKALLYGLFLGLMGLWCTGAAFSQTEHFVHLQSENGQSYAVSWNGIAYTAAANGYLVIPKVPPGNQKFVISFPGRNYPDMSFSFLMGNQSQAFSLQLAIDNTWRLFDLVHLSALQGVVSTDTPKLTEKETEVKSNTPQATPAVVKNFVLMANPKDSGIQKIFEKATTGGIDMVYVVDNNGVTDTIAVFIPVTQQNQPVPMAMDNVIDRIRSRLSPYFLQDQPRRRWTGKVLLSKPDEIVK